MYDPLAMQTQSRASTRLHVLEFETWRVLKRFSGQKLLVAVSGGRDSVALLEALARVQARLGLSLAVAHVHHGQAKDKKLNVARARASELVARHAERLQLPFFLETGHELGGSRKRDASEESLRDLRHARLSALREREGFDWVVYAHHHEDLLETRVLRLVRGTGAAGIRAMRLRGAGRRLRPWLGVRRDRIEAYARERRLLWCHDPTNSDTGPLRNWLRVEWLPQLEKKRPGALDSLARSLGLLAEAAAGAKAAERWGRLGEVCIIDGVIDRTIFVALPEAQRRFVLALYARKHGIRDLGRQRLLEICKRLDTDQKSLSFSVGGLYWTVNAGQIFAGPVVKDDKKT